MPTVTVVFAIVVPAGPEQEIEYVDVTAGAICTLPPVDVPVIQGAMHPVASVAAHRRVALSPVVIMTGSTLIEMPGSFPETVAAEFVPRTDARSTPQPVAAIAAIPIKVRLNLLVPIAPPGSCEC
jgi:hypothetical protein